MNGASGGMSSAAPPQQQQPPVKESQPQPHDEAFEELYCAAYAALDRHWLAARATYMEFPSVMRSVPHPSFLALAKTLPAIRASGIADVVAVVSNEQTEIDRHW